MKDICRVSRSRKIGRDAVALVSMRLECFGMTLLFTLRAEAENW
jgi:hypothetical protein